MEVKEDPIHGEPRRGPALPEPDGHEEGAEPPDNLHSGFLLVLKLSLAHAALIVLAIMVQPSVGGVLLFGSCLTQWLYLLPVVLYLFARGYSRKPIGVILGGLASSALAVFAVGVFCASLI